MKIRLVQDNLNTHCKSALYATFAAAEACTLTQRFEFYCPQTFHCTPQSASWLNMVEIEFCVLSRHCLSRHCLNRGIPTLEQVEREVLALLQERQDKPIKINGQFNAFLCPKGHNDFPERLCCHSQKCRLS
jgi:hypothetical protein